MKRALIILLSVMLFLSGCTTANNQKVGSDNSGDGSENAYKMVDLGICSAASTLLPLNARNPWDMTVVDGKLYVGTGDYDDNSGPTHIWMYDDKKKDWTTSAIVQEEAIARFVDLNGKTVALGVDHIGETDFGDTYVLDGDKWNLDAHIGNTIHVFDAEYFDGSVYYGLGSRGENPAVVRYDAEKDEYVGVPLFRAGVEVIPALNKLPNLQTRRAYDLFNLNGKLFCGFSCYLTTGKLTLEFFELVDDKFEFRQAYINSNLKANNRVARNQIYFNCDAVYQGGCYLSLGDLFKTEDFIDFKKITIPDNGCVTDMWVEKTGDKEQLYILATVEGEKNFKNTVYNLIDDGTTEVFSFESEISALSLAKDGKSFYVGLGRNNSQNSENGRILKFEQS